MEKEEQESQRSAEDRHDEVWEEKLMKLRAERELIALRSIDSETGSDPLPIFVIC